MGIGYWGVGIGDWIKAHCSYNYLWINKYWFIIGEDSELFTCNPSCLIWGSVTPREREGSQSHREQKLQRVGDSISRNFPLLQKALRELEDKDEEDKKESE